MTIYIVSLWEIELEAEKKTHKAKRVDSLIWPAISVTACFSDCVSVCMLYFSTVLSRFVRVFFLSLFCPFFLAFSLYYVSVHSIHKTSYEKHV